VSVRPGICGGSENYKIINHEAGTRSNVNLLFPLSPASMYEGVTVTETLMKVCSLFSLLFAVALNVAHC
jgi:hypothetical protein